ncbi:MAG: hypothetical protein Q8R28_23620 [Dehalococcoidia bacterium]|nr:hypothetical protein [Dehalococcoidia bacterium]
MLKKVIQVPIDSELLSALDNLSMKQGQARAEVIRLACHHYLRHVEIGELDRLYQEGYDRSPEEAELGEAQTALAAEVLPAESW